LEQKWPQTLWIVRHGQSAGNVARDAAELDGLATIALAHRDVDVPLSARGEQQACALGDWFAGLAREERPDVVLSSPYVRARQTADRVVDALRAQSRRRSADDETIACVRDERLREKEFGILDRLTPLGIRAKYPELAEQRQHVGKFYFRPPGGESWCDVILRLRSFLEMLTREYRGDRVLVVAHQVIVNCVRYLLERLDEDQILTIDRLGDVPNCGITSYAFEPSAGRRGKLVLQLENFVSPLREAGAPVTAEPDRPAAPKA
jgi:broad specificity phosphatase PhoE